MRLNPKNRKKSDGLSRNPRYIDCDDAIDIDDFETKGHKEATIVSNHKKSGRKALPSALSQKTTVPMHPEMHREIRIASLRDGYESVAEWLHNHFCHALGREDLLLPSPQAVTSR